MSETMSVLKPELGEETVSTGLEFEARREISKQLSAILTDTYYLVIKSHIYHWNVVGPMFHAIHKMTEDQYKDMFAATDVIAERIRALGFHAPLSEAAGPGQASVSMETSAKSAADMLKDLIDDHESAIRKMRQAAGLAEKYKDFVSHDLLVGRMTFHEQVAWMLRSLITEQIDGH